MAKEDKIGSLWVNKEKGNIWTEQSMERVIIFKNGFKQADVQPDYIVYKSKPKEEKKEDGFVAVEDNQLPF